MGEPTDPRPVSSDCELPEGPGNRPLSQQNEETEAQKLRGQNETPERCDAWWRVMERSMKLKDRWKTSKAKPRVHLYTHPILGIASWRDICNAAASLRTKERTVCTWCHGPVQKPKITACSEECRARCRFCWTGSGRIEVIRRDNFKCVLCGSGDRTSEFEVDHIIPMMLGGTSDLWNLRTLCVPCHKVETRRLKSLGIKYTAIHFLTVKDGRPDHSKGIPMTEVIMVQS